MKVKIFYGFYIKCRKFIFYGKLYNILGTNNYINQVYFEKKKREREMYYP